MLAKNISRRAVVEGVAEAEAPRHLGDDPPVGPRLARHRQKRALTRNAPLRIGDSTAFLAPSRGGKQHVGAGLDRVITANVFGDDEQFEVFQRIAHRPGARQ